MRSTQNTEQATPPIQSLQSFIAGMGKKPITGWRWRKNGWLTTINIAGRQYITAEAIAEFKRRAVAGEFTKEHAVPSKQQEAA